MAVAMETDQAAVQFYSSGVITCECVLLLHSETFTVVYHDTAGCGASVNDMALVVGYGTSGLTNYYKVI